MKNIKNYILIGSNNLSKLLKEINEISTIKVTIYKETSKKTFIILPHLASGKQTSGREIKITVTDNEELGEILNGIEIISGGKMEKALETCKGGDNLNQKEVIILKSPPLCGKMFEFLTETQGLFSNDNICTALQRNRFYATDGQTANSMHLLPISQFSRDALVTGGSSFFSKITGSDEEGVDLNSKLQNEIKDQTEGDANQLRSKSHRDLKLEKRISEFETCLSEIFYDSLNEEIVLVEQAKRTKNSKSSPAVVEVHEFISNDTPRVRKSRVLIVSQSRFKKLENSFAKFQAKKKIRHLETLLTAYDNKNDIMEKLENKFVEKFRRMQNTYKKQNLIVMNFDLPGRFNDDIFAETNDSKIENNLMASTNISKTYLDSLKSSFETVKKRKNRGNLVVVNDQIFKMSTNTNKVQNKHFLRDDNKALVFLNSAIYKELEKETVDSILSRKYSTGENKMGNGISVDPNAAEASENKVTSVKARGFSEIPLDNLIAAVADKNRLEYEARSKLVWEVYEHYERILENTKILNPQDVNSPKNNDANEHDDLSKVFKAGSANRKPALDVLEPNTEVKPKEMVTENANENVNTLPKVYKGHCDNIIPVKNLSIGDNEIISTLISVKDDKCFHNEHNLPKVFKGESGCKASAIDLLNQKKQLTSEVISVKDNKANENIGHKKHDTPKVYKGESSNRLSTIRNEKNKITASQVVKKQLKVDENIDQSEHDLRKGFEGEFAKRLLPVVLPSGKEKTVSKEVSIKEVKTVKNIAFNDQELLKVLKTESAKKLPEIDLASEKKKSTREVFIKEKKFAEHVVPYKYDLLGIFKGKPAENPLAINLPNEETKIKSEEVFVQDVKAGQNIVDNEYDLSKGESKKKNVEDEKAADYIDAQNVKIEMTNGEISSKLTTDEEHFHFPQSTAAAKSRIPVKVLHSPKTITPLAASENDDKQGSMLQTDETFFNNNLMRDQNAVTSEEHDKEVTVATPGNVQKITVNAKSNTCKSRLPRLVSPIKHTITKDTNETFLRLPKPNDDLLKDEEESREKKKKSSVTTEVESFIDVKSVVKSNPLFADVHRLIFNEQEQEEVFSKKAIPNKFQLQFLQNMVKEPVESAYQNVKSNVEDCAAIVKKMVTKIEIEETASHLKIAKREPGTFVITEPTQNEGSCEEKKDVVSSTSKSVAFQMKTKTSTQQKEVPQKTQTFDHIDNFEASGKSLVGPQEQELNETKPVPVPKQNEIDEPNNIGVREKGKSNVLKKVEKLEKRTKQAEAKGETHEMKQLEEKRKNAYKKPKTQSSTSKKCTVGKTTTTELPVSAAPLTKENETNIILRQPTIKADDVIKKEAVHSEDKLEMKKKQQLKKKTSINMTEKITGAFKGSGVSKTDTKIDNSNKKNSIFKGLKTQQMKVDGKTVNVKEKVISYDKKKQKNEEKNLLVKNNSGAESKKIPNDLGPNSGVIDGTSTIKENSKILKEVEQQQIEETINRFIQNEQKITQLQSEMRESCKAEERAQLSTDMSEDVIKDNITATEETTESLDKFELTGQDKRLIDNEMTNVTVAEVSESMNGIQSKTSEIWAEKNKVLIEEVHEENLNEVVEEPASDKTIIFANSATLNIKDSTDKAAIYNEIPKETIKEDETEKEKEAVLLPTESENLAVTKNVVETGNVTGLMKVPVATETSDTNVDCRLIVVESIKQDVTERSTDSTEISGGFTQHRITIVDNVKLEDRSEKPNDLSENIDEEKLVATNKITEIVDYSEDAKVSIKKTTDEKECSVTKSQSHKDKCRNDVLKNSASENVIIIKPAKKDSEETLESVLGITKPFLEQIQSKMLNFVTKKTKSKAKIRNFSFRSHAVKKCKEITALLKQSQEKVLEDNSAGLANIYQHAKMINRFSRTKLPPKRLNDNTTKTGNTFVTNATDKPKQPSDKKTKKKTAPPEEIVKSAIESKVVSKMKSLAKPTNEVKKLSAVKAIKSLQIPTNYDEGKQPARSEETKEIFTPSGSATDLGKESIGSIFAEVVASALVKCGKVEDSVIQRSDSQDQLANIVDATQDVKQKPEQTEIPAKEEDVDVEDDPNEKIRDPDEFIIDGSDLRKLGLNVKFLENKGRCSGDKYKCSISLVLNKKVNEEDVKLPKIEMSVQDDEKSKDFFMPLAKEVIKQNEESIETQNEDNLTKDDKPDIKVQVIPIDNVCKDHNIERTERKEKVLDYTGEIGKNNEIDVEVRSQTLPVSEKTTRDDQKCMLKEEDKMNRHAFEFMHAQSTNAAPKVSFDKLLKDNVKKNKNPQENLDNEVTVIKNNQEVVISVPIQKKIPRDINDTSGFLEELGIGVVKKKKKGGDGSTVPVPEHLVRFNKAQNENEFRTSKLKSFVGKPQVDNVEISKIVEYHGLNRQNRNSAIKYLSYSNEFTKNTLDVFPEVFLTPFTSKPDLAKEVDVVNENPEEDFGILKNLSNLDKDATGVSKIIHIATSDNSNNNVKHLAFVNDIRTACRVNDFPNSKICFEKEKPAAKNIEYLKRRIEKDRLTKVAKSSKSKDEIKSKDELEAKKKKEEILSNKKTYNELSEGFREAFAGLEKMGNSINEKPAQRDNVAEKSSISKPVGDYLQNQKRDFATKNPIIYTTDLVQNLTEKLFPKNCNLEEKTKFVQMKAELPKDINEKTDGKQLEIGKSSKENVSRKNSFYHEMVRRSEVNKKKTNKEKEKEVPYENSTSSVFNALKESFDEAYAAKKVFLGSKPSMKQYAEMIMAKETKSSIDLPQIKDGDKLNESCIKEQSSKMKVLENINPKRASSEICLRNVKTAKLNYPQAFCPIDISTENYKNVNSPACNNSNKWEFEKVEAPGGKTIQTYNVTSILDRKEKRPVDSVLKAVHYKPLVIEDLQVTVGKKSGSRKEDHFGIKPKASQIPIRTSEATPKHSVLEKFAAIDREPGSPVYKIRRDLKFDSSTKRIQKTAPLPQDKHKSRSQVTSPKSKGVSIQENTTKRPTSAKSKSKKMMAKLTSSRELYFPASKTYHDDLKRALLKNPSKLLEIAGEIMDKNQYLNFLLDLKSRKEIRNIWWKKIYEGILSSLKIAESVPTKPKKCENTTSKVKSTLLQDAGKTKSKKAMKVVKKESFNLEPLFIAPKKERKKEKVTGFKEKAYRQNLGSAKPPTAKSRKPSPNSEEKEKRFSADADFDNLRSKSANLKSPNGNQVLKNDTTQDGTNRRNLSSQHRESVNFKSSSLPYTLKKFLESPDLTPKKTAVKNKKSAENLQKVFVLGEELKCPYTVARLEMSNEFGIFNTQGYELSLEDQAQKNLKEDSIIPQLSTCDFQKNVVTTGMSEEESIYETILSAEEDVKPFEDCKKINTNSIRQSGSSTQGGTKQTEATLNISQKEPLDSTNFAEMEDAIEKSLAKEMLNYRENLNKEEGIEDCNNIYVELSAHPSTEKNFLDTYDDMKLLEQANSNIISRENSAVHLEKQSNQINSFERAKSKSIASSVRNCSDVDNYFDVLSIPISSTRSEMEECKINVEPSELGNFSDVLSNRSAPVSSEYSVARGGKNVSVGSSKGKILTRNNLFDDMSKSKEKFVIDAKQTGLMNFQARRKFENPLSRVVPKKKVMHSGRVTNQQHSQEAIAHSPMKRVENIPKVRVIRTKSFSEVLKDDPCFLKRLRDKKKSPYVTPKRIEDAPRKFEYRYHDFRRKYESGKVASKIQPRRKDFFEKFRDLIQTKRPFGENNQQLQEDESESKRPKIVSKFLGKMKEKDDESVDMGKTDNADGAATDRSTNSTRNFCNSLLLKSKLGSWRFVHTKTEHIDEDELMTWVQEHPSTPISRSKIDNSKGDEEAKKNVIHVPWISSSAHAEEEK